jgi:geranylgeranyl reductase family protein
MRATRYDAVVVGAGPAGSTAAIVLARGGARVALVDKASFPRDKACGDLVGPRGLALLDDLGLAVPGGRRVAEMLVVGPSGRRVVLPARAGRTYPGHGLAIPRKRFDAWLRDAALDAGAEPVTGRVGAGRYDDTGQLVGVTLDDGRTLDGDVVIGADGATSAVAAAAGLVDPLAIMWGFAQRGYVDEHVDLPVIALWDEAPRRGFPGYGWLFPGYDAANVGLGIGVASRRADASRAVTRFDHFCAHLTGLGLLSAAVPDRRLGGWLKMGVVGTIPAHQRTLLVGDAAGLVNPLQGEGIAPALASGRAAAEAVLGGVGTAAAQYRRVLARVHAPYLSVAAPIHAASIAGSRRRVSLLGRALTMPGLSRAIAGPWALYWNDLRDGAPAGLHAALATTAHGVGRLATSRAATRKRLHTDLTDDHPQRSTS